MNHPDHGAKPVTLHRRRFIAGAATLPAAAFGLPQEAAAAQTPANADGPTPPLAGLRWLLPHEALAIEAWGEVLIPTDALGPGARATGVARYVDGQLAGSFGHMGRSYRSGPWREGTVEQGWQSPLLPAEAVRLGLIELDSLCRARDGKAFAELAPERQAEWVRAIDRNEATFNQMGARLFFELLYGLTMESYFADPVYGGNAGMAGWKLVGYPGAAAAYIGAIGQHGVPYRVKPVGLTELQSGAAPNDSLGHAVHEPLPATSQGAGA